jgi:hypothetical protein
MSTLTEDAFRRRGSIAVELGDTYAGSGGAGGDYSACGLRDGQPAFGGSAKARRTSDGYLPDCAGDGWPADKSLSLIPESYRWALAYGRNPFTGRPTPRWRVRNTVRWVRPNPPVGRDGDKFRPATSDVVIACRTDEAGRRRYWDGDAVRTAAKYGVVDNQRPNMTAEYSAPGQPDRKTRAVTDAGRINSNPAGAPLLDWWKISPGGYGGAHYAVFPPALVEPLVKAMCPHRVCAICGEPSRRIVAVEHVDGGNGGGGGAATKHGTAGMARLPERRSVIAETLGWTDCQCSPDGSHWRPGIVLDPFAGSGTTLAVATGHGRSSIGIDLDERNIRLACDRVGSVFFHETTVAELASEFLDAA